MNDERSVHNASKRKIDMVCDIRTKYIHLEMWSAIDLPGLWNWSPAVTEVRKNCYSTSSRRQQGAWIPNERCLRPNGLTDK